MNLPVFLGKLPFQWNLWFTARLLPVLAKRCPLEGLLDFATPVETVPAYTMLPAGEIVRAVKDVSARPWRMRGRRCLREGLLAYRFLCMAGYRPILHFGILPDTVKSDRPRAHCWISLDGETILNPATERMVDLFTYDGRNAISDMQVLSQFGVADA